MMVLRHGGGQRLFVFRALGFKLWRRFLFLNAVLLLCLGVTGGGLWARRWQVCAWCVHRIVPANEVRLGYDVLHRVRRGHRPHEG